MFVYVTQSAQLAENFTTHASANTAVDHQFLKPGAARTLTILSLIVGGKGVGLTSLTGIAFRLEHYPTTSSAVGSGTSKTPQPQDVGAQACKATGAMGANSGATVAAGTGTLVFHGGCVCGGASGNGWNAENADAAAVLEAGANMSMDLFSSSGGSSMAFEYTIKHSE